MKAPVSPITIFVVTMVLMLLGGQQSQAHFGMVIPADPVITEQNRSTDISLSFSHPFAGVGMDLEQPTGFYMVKDGQQTDLLSQLEPSKIMGSSGFLYHFRPKRPGVYQFIMEPKPYWEPIEDRFIIHYTKTIIPVFGSEENWMQTAGLPVEIRPLLRPFGNYLGNSFTGQVLINGKPAADAEVEIEYYNSEQRYRAPTDYHTTQVLLTDADGIFNFTCPLSGWWGFASLSLADYTLKGPEGQNKEVELGAVLWIYMDDYKDK